MSFICLRTILLDSASHAQDRIRSLSVLVGFRAKNCRQACLTGHIYGADLSLCTRGPLRVCPDAWSTACSSLISALLQLVHDSCIFKNYALGGRCISWSHIPKEPSQLRDSWVETPVGSYLRVGWHWALLQVHYICFCCSVFSAVHSLGWIARAQPGDSPGPPRFPPSCEKGYRTRVFDQSCN